MSHYNIYNHRARTWVDQDEWKKQRKKNPKKKGVFSHLQNTWTLEHLNKQTKQKTLEAIKMYVSN